MAGDKYRILNPTIALFLEDGRHVAHLVPQTPSLWSKPKS